MATNVSAFVGTPPNSTDDYNIIRGIYRAYGIPDAAVDPGVGYVFAAHGDAGDTESKTGAIIGGMCLVILAVVVPTTARIYIKATGHNMKFGPDDWAIICAACLAVCYPALVIAMCLETGAGHHVYTTTYDQYATFLYYLFACKLVYYIAVGLVKISITLLVRRLADRASRKWRLFADVFLGSVLAYILLALFWTTFLCSPPEVGWNMRYAGTRPTPTTCLNANTNAIVLSSIHVAQGIVLLLAPVAILWHVRIDTAKKIRLFVIWAVGGLTVTGSLLQRTAVTITNDATWQFTSIVRWTTLDLALGVTTASLPVLDAAIMGSWVAAKTRLGFSQSNTQSNTHSGGSGSGSGSGPKSWPASSARHMSKRSAPTTCAPSTPRRYSELTDDGTPMCPSSADHPRPPPPARHVQMSDHDMEMHILRTHEISVQYDGVQDDAPDVSAHRGVKQASRLGDGI